MLKKSIEAVQSTTKRPFASTESSDIKGDLVLSLPPQTASSHNCCLRLQ